MLKFWLAVFAGALCGVLSGFGIGGGSLLMVWMTAVLSMDQRAAQGINLLYFLPTSALALVSHIKNKIVDFRLALPAIIAGSVTTAVSAFAATAISTALLKKAFGVFLVCVGARELFSKAKK